MDIKQWEERNNRIKDSLKNKLREQIDNGLMGLRKTQSYSALVNRSISDDEAQTLVEQYKEDGWEVELVPNGERYIKVRLPKHLRNR